MTSLRDELTGERPPDVSYTLLCPPGWSKIPPTALTDEGAVASALAAMKGAGRADLVVQFRSMLARLKASLRERGVFDVYVAPEGEPGAPMPAMLTVSPFVLPTGVTWDAAITRIAKGGSIEEAIGEVELYLVRRRSEYSDESAVVQSEDLTYVAPLPGGDGRRALLFQFTVLSVDDENSAEMAKGLIFVGEAIMSTLRWVVPA